MAKKFSLLADLEECNITPPRQYQQFEAELGFEKLVALVPVENADLFEQAAMTAQPKGRTGLTKIVAQFGGTVL